ncbi:MAG: signal peptide peptidase SppA, partial [Planctomycetaceae bacterium]
VLLLLTTATSAAPPEAKQRPARIPVFSLSGVITEQATDTGFPFVTGSASESLHSLLTRLEKAGQDDSVPAIVLLTGSSLLGRAQLEEVRQALDKIRAGGKHIHAHADMMMTSDLALLSGSTEISMVPTGNLFITGLYGEQLFLRGLLDKIGVQPDYFTCGEFKSAGEMFMRTTPSPQSEAMNNWLFDGIFANMTAAVASGRKVAPEQVHKWIDHGVFTAEKAKEAGIIDSVLHRRAFEVSLRQAYGADLKFDRAYGQKKQATIDLSSPMGILQFYGQLLSPPRRQRNFKDSVAIVYLEGPIMPGSGGGSPLGGAIAFSTTIRKALDQVAEDDSIKAVVFRVNSPGGSAVASEIILSATKRVAAKKPFIVSMGDVAGSGGYYVACAAETIFADPSTVTGSIGVVSGKFATTKMWNKMGITFKPIQRGANSGILSSANVFSDSEKSVMKSYMDEVYEVFKGHVVAIRGDRLKKDIEDLAGGRVFTGRQALKLGLVDELGGLHDAIDFAAQKAQLKSYEIRIVPRPKNLIEQLMSDLGPAGNDSPHLQFAPRGLDLLQTVMPYLQGLDRQRTQIVAQALLQLTITQRERVMLTMPLFHFQR